MRNKIVFGTILIIFLIPVSYGEYCATDIIKGKVCKGFVIEACKFVRVDAVNDENGKLFTISKCYDDVSDYKGSDQRCWIRTKSKGGGLLSWALNATAQPEFLHKNDDGNYEKIDVEYLTFKCVKL